MAFGITPLASSEFPAEYCQQFDEQGYVRIPGFIDSDEVALIRENLSRVITEVVPSMPATDVFYEDKADKGSLKQLIRLSHHDEFFEQLFLKSRFFRLAECLLRRPAAGQNMQFFNKPAGIGLPTPPHQDGHYWKITPMEGLTMWLALEKVDEENGCVRYIKGSHRRGIRAHGQTGTLGFSQGMTDYGDLEREQELCMNAEAGDLLVHDSLTIHRADGNHSQTRSRQAMGFIYYSARAQTDSLGLQEYQASMVRDMVAKGKL